MVFNSDLLLNFGKRLHGQSAHHIELFNGTARDLPDLLFLLSMQQSLLGQRLVGHGPLARQILVTHDVRCHSTSGVPLGEKLQLCVLSGPSVVVCRRATHGSSVVR